jgi:hypothetical protein
MEIFEFREYFGKVASRLRAEHVAISDYEWPKATIEVVSPKFDGMSGQTRLNWLNGIGLGIDDGGWRDLKLTFRLFTPSEYALAQKYRDGQRAK